ncbi:histidine kinase [Daejeonella sp. H1SJ63]|uniref:sensor histidine kinase n=1 Tax=Daejeonella sp. H1SJ63 TaxID=3034145 RepID=UPI0023EC75F7|nr:histidine kinase [Daejeonella sp. H1SJ63]
MSQQPELKKQNSTAHILSGNKITLVAVQSIVACIIAQSAILFWFGFSAQTALIDSTISILLLTIACYMIGNNLKYYRPEKNRYLLMLLYCSILASLWLIVNNWALANLLLNDPSYSEFLYNSLPVRFFIGLLIIGLMAMVSVVWYTQEDQKESEKRKTEAERLAREAELYNLRQQLQPHFLFNSLNSITALIGSRPEEARKMIHQLSDFLRGTLKKEDQQPVSLMDELEHLQLYLDIEKVRFGHRLSTEISYNESCKTKLIPPMLLQPIVENAIKFGLYDTTGVVTISIFGECTENELHITVQNPFDPDTSRPKHGTGFGLSGVKRRLHLLFGRTDLLETTSHSHIFTTIVKIPQL